VTIPIIPAIWKAEVGEEGLLFKAIPKTNVKPYLKNN
jgi:hypothetical protein